VPLPRAPSPRRSPRRFEVASYDNATTITYGKGGFQGARGGPGSDWYIENAIELLDSPTEW